jgi:hypothetical protein
MRQLGLGNEAFHSYVIYFSVIVPHCHLMSKLVLEPSVIVRIVPWIGKASIDNWGSWVCGGGEGGGLASFFIWE